MPVFKALKTWTFSEFELTVLLDGEPLADAKLTRTVEWLDKRKDVYRTDSAGLAILPAVGEFSLRFLLPIEFLSFQLITVESNGEEVEIWSYAKRNTGYNSENAGEPIRVTCELNSEAVSGRLAGALITTRCDLGEALQPAF